MLLSWCEWVILLKTFFYLFEIMMHGRTSKQRQAVLNKIPSIASLFLLQLLLWINISNVVITLSSKDRVAFNAPSGRPNGKQYLQQQKLHCVCRKSCIQYTHFWMQCRGKKPRTVYISGSWLVGRESKMGYGQQGEKTMLNVNNTMQLFLRKGFPYLLWLTSNAENHKQNCTR